MRHFTLIVLMAVFVASVTSLTCINCDEMKKNNWCAVVTPDMCDYGMTTGVCYCCPVCYKGPGETCGGYWGEDGKCATGYECITSSQEYDPYQPGLPNLTGICRSV